jgi:hypothetical protein
MYFVPAFTKFVAKQFNFNVQKKFTNFFLLLQIKGFTLFFSQNIIIFLVV